MYIYRRLKVRNMRVRFPIFILIFTLFFSVDQGYAQWNNTEFMDPLPTDSARTKNLFFSVHTLSFLKDNEYASYIADGYTLFGFQFQPFFTYYPMKNVRVNAGVYLQKDFGNKNFSTIDPFFSVKLNYRHLDIVFGNLEGALNHRLIEPLYDFERVLKDRQEHGLQFLYTGNHFMGDLWVNWETMIYKGSPFQEEISGGISMTEKINLNENFSLDIPIQMIVYHRGGQIDSSPGRVLTRYNFSSGIDMKVQLKGFFNQLNLAGYYAYSNGGNPPNGIKSDSVVYGNGNGAYFNLGLTTRNHFQIIGSFWAASNFSSEKGGQLYPSESSSYKKAGLVEPKRTLFILRVFHTWKLADNLFFSSRIEPYYDFRVDTFEFAFGFYLNYRPEFFLWKAK